MRLLRQTLHAGREMRNEKCADDDGSLRVAKVFSFQLLLHTLPELRPLLFTLIGPRREETVETTPEPETSAGKRVTR